MASEKFRLGIDLGTANMIVYMEKKGIIFNEPSIIAFDRDSGRVVAAGTEAQKMLGKTHEKIILIRPLRNGVIGDMHAARELLKYVFGKVEAMTERQLSNTVAVVCCPSEVTKIERDTIIELIKSMNIKDVFVEEEIKAGAMGAGLDIFMSRGAMIVDMGGGTTDVGVLSFGDIVLSRTIRKSGDYINTEIGKFVKKKYKVEIGEITSELAKIELSDLRTNATPISNRYAGRDIVLGIPKYVDISSEDVKDIIVPVYEEIVKLISSVFKETSPELSADIYSNGILLAGGGALVKGVDEFISHRLNVPVKVCRNVLTCVAEGAKFLLKNRGDYLVNPLQL